MSLANYRTISRPPISNQPITKMGRIIADEFRLNHRPHFCRLHTQHFLHLSTRCKSSHLGYQNFCLVLTTKAEL
ncbi:hypothetical protein T07_14323 [Trichinella nelsoni]|uniref:Uncharacterized protein n=1 Tax=Trichinella nelsoni TaxID=6336 RepID=A0A0V0RPB1_9BILA|nr:hypothetical protein T07_14323 [Trichinella nelsoni]